MEEIINNPDLEPSLKDLVHELVPDFAETSEFVRPYEQLPADNEVLPEPIDSAYEGIFERETDKEVKAMYSELKRIFIGNINKKWGLAWNVITTIAEFPTSTELIKLLVTLAAHPNGPIRTYSGKALSIMRKENPDDEFLTWFHEQIIMEDIAMDMHLRRGAVGDIKRLSKIELPTFKQAKEQSYPNKSIIEFFGAGSSRLGEIPKSIQALKSLTYSDINRRVLQYKLEQIHDIQDGNRTLDIFTAELEKLNLLMQIEEYNEKFQVNDLPTMATQMLEHVPFLATNQEVISEVLFNILKTPSAFDINTKQFRVINGEPQELRRLEFSEMDLVKQTIPYIYLLDNAEQREQLWRVVLGNIDTYQDQKMFPNTIAFFIESILKYVNYEKPTFVIEFVTALQEKGLFQKAIEGEGLPEMQKKCDRAKLQSFYKYLVKKRLEGNVN